MSAGRLLIAAAPPPHSRAPNTVKLLTGKNIPGVDVSNERGHGGLSSHRGAGHPPGDKVTARSCDRLSLIVREQIWLGVCRRAQTSNPARRSGPCRCSPVCRVRPLAYQTWAWCRLWRAPPRVALSVWWCWYAWREPPARTGTKLTTRGSSWQASWLRDDGACVE